MGNTYNYYGRVVGGNSFKGWNVQYDLLPHNDNIIKGINRTKLSLVGAAEEEVEYDHAPPPDMVDGILVNDHDASSDEDERNDDMSSSTKSKRKKLSASKQSIKNFTSMDKNDIANADHFDFCYGTNKKIGKITWKILSDEDYLEDNDKIE